MAWLYVPASVDSNSGCAESGKTCAQSAGSSETPSPPPFLSPGCEKEPWTRLLCGMTSPHSMAQRGVDAWISSLRATHASHSVWPANAEASQTNGTSGRTLPESFARWDRDGSCWRTSQGTFPWASPTFSGRWPRWGTMRSGAAIRQSKPGVPTAESDCSCWPTPVAHDSVKGKTQAQVEAMRQRTGAGVSNLNETAENLWPTATACLAQDGENPETWLERRERVKLTAQNGNGMGMPLTIAAMLWQTPQTDSFRSRGGDRKREIGLDRQSKMASYDLSHQARAMETPGSGSPQRTRRPSLRLNPVFVEWLMGFPRGWSLPFVGTDSAASGTQ